eukprot:scaffold152046_cov55-Attheya_sp.AAC.2
MVWKLHDSTLISLSQSGGAIPELYVITPERRKYLHYFAEVLGLPPYKWDQLLVDTFSFIHNHHVG